MNFERLQSLCCTYGVSGAENECARLIDTLMREYCTESYVDSSGNLFCLKKSDIPDAPVVVLDAHMDSVGFMVKEICEGGFVKFECVGGIDRRILPSLEVVIHGRKQINGVITSKPPHLMGKENEEKFPKIDEMYIDTGYTNDLNTVVRVGDRISFVQGAAVMGECICGTYLDDRAGCSLIIDVFEYFRDKQLPFDLVGVFTIQEELGLCGAKFADISPDLVVVIDVTHGSTPDEKGNRVYKTGGGCAIGAGPNMDKYYFEMIKKCAEGNDIAYQTEVMEGNTGTNAWAYQLKGIGTPCEILSFPLKFMHTPVETMKISDYDNTAELVKVFLSELDVKQIHRGMERIKGRVL